MSNYVRRLVARMLWNGMTVDQIIHSTGVSVAEVGSVVDEMNSLTNPSAS
jgi:uncharacterized protein YerC